MTRYHNKNPIIRKKLKPLTLVARKEWGALPPGPGSEKETLMTITHPVDKVIVQYTTDKVCNSKEDCLHTIREMQKKHIEEGFADIRYNFIVCGDGDVYEGRGWEFRPAPNGAWPEWHGESYEIAHVGMHGIRTLPDHMTKAAWDILQVGIENKCLKEDYSYNPDLFDAYAEGYF